MAEDAYTWSEPKCQIDERLRAWGYQIVLRPSIGEPIWKHHVGKIPLKQSLVLKRINFLSKRRWDSDRDCPDDRLRAKALRTWEHSYAG